jgi:hypothetical protein
VFNISKARNNILSAVIKVATKAKAKPKSVGKQVRDILDDSTLSTKQRIAAIAILQEDLNDAMVDECTSDA